MIWHKRKLISLFGHNQLNSIDDRLGVLEKKITNVLLDSYLKDFLYTNEKYRATKRITRHIRSIFSQNGEDGIIEEIFRRIGVGNRCFVEFGVHGLKNNSTFLAIKGWTGIWLEGSEVNCKQVNKLIQESQLQNLKVIHRFLYEDNIETVFNEIGIDKEPTLLSIDIDGNDYYIWKGLKTFKPRLVVIEYNATLGPSDSLVMEYTPNYSWDGTNYFGASLKALELLGRKKGYYLVGCDFSGTNAFFVREDLVRDKFEQPYTSENHFEPARYFLQRQPGHPPGIGPYIINPEP